MDVAARRQRAGEHEAASLPSTSTIRFVLLIVLVIVTSASTGSYLSLLNGSLGRLVRGALPCLNDTGIVVGGPVPPAGVLGSQSVLRCSAPVSIVMTSSMAILAAAVVGGAYLLYLALPWWRVRRHRLTRLPAGAGPLRPYFDSLVHEVGLSHPPVFLIAPYNRMAAGLAFSRRGRPMIQCR